MWPTLAGLFWQSARLTETSPKVLRLRSPTRDRGNELIDPRRLVGNRTFPLFLAEVVLSPLTDDFIIAPGPLRSRLSGAHGESERACWIACYVPQGTST